MCDAHADEEGYCPSCAARRALPATGGSAPAPAGYVRTDAGQVLVQLPAENPYGFILADDDQEWPGGLGAAVSWELLDDGDPSIPLADRQRLGWLLDLAEPGREQLELRALWERLDTPVESLCTQAGVQVAEYRRYAGGYLYSDEAGGYRLLDQIADHDAVECFEQPF